MVKKEPFNEVLATIILKRIGTVPFIPYSVVWEEGVPYSFCEDFVTADTELISAWNIFNIRKKRNETSVYQHYLNCCEELEIPSMKLSLDMMMTIDYLIVNTDRHFNNFGAVRNAETLKWMGAAPLFDCGTSMWHDKPTTMIVTSDYDTPCRPFKAKHSTQMELVSSYDWLDFSKLAGVEEEYHELLLTNPFIDEKRREVLVKVLANRITGLQDLVQEKTRH